MGLLNRTGLVVIGTIGYDLFTNSITDWRAYAEKLAAIDWRRSADMWKGNVVLENGKIALGHSAVRSAIQGVCGAIGWVRPPAGRRKALALPADDQSGAEGMADCAEAVGSANSRKQVEDSIQEIAE